MSKRYDQFCGAARALEIVGDRWTLLLVRELLTGPKRFTDLRRSLHGVPPNLLSDRLRALEADGVVERATTPPPAPSAPYRLTLWGEELRATVLALARWGSPLLTRRDTDTLPASALLIGVEGRFRPELAGKIALNVEFHVDDEVATAVIDHGTIVTTWGPHGEPDVVVRADAQTLLAWVTGELSDSAAVAAGLDATGGARTLTTLRGLFSRT